MYHARLGESREIHFGVDEDRDSITLRRGVTRSAPNPHCNLQFTPNYLLLHPPPQSLSPIPRKTRPVAML